MSGRAAPRFDLTQAFGKQPSGRGNSPKITLFTILKNEMIFHFRPLFFDLFGGKCCPVYWHQIIKQLNLLANKLI
jgi:hypothetical protein